MSYGERLIYPGLPSLKYRRARSDIVETYKIINGIDCENIFPIRESNTRGHKYKIFKKKKTKNTAKQRKENLVFHKVSWTFEIHCLYHV